LSLARLRRELLPGTLEHASGLPWYRKHWGKRWRAVTDVEQLWKLPTLDKAEAAKSFKQLTHRAVAPSAGVVSSGTTGASGPLLMVARIPAEGEAAAEFARTRWTDWTPRVGPEVLRGIALEVRAMHHGVPLGPPPGGRLRMPWTYTGTAFRQFAQLLGARHGGRRITSLVIGAGALMPLTLWLLEQGIDPARFKVRLIGTNGFRLSPFWRERIAALWKAELWDNFSLSEFVTPAMECPDCGFHHWLAPPLVHEVLDVYSQEPLSHGVGELALTGLYPFVQAMPLVRYRTGDLVEIGPRCRHGGDIGFRPRGRISQAVLDKGVSGDPLLVCGQDVQEILEAESAVARHPHPVERLELVKSNDIGAVKYRLARERRRIRLEIEVRHDPRVFVAASEALVARVAAALRKASRRLREGSIALDVVAVAPGTLTAPWSKF
jgi:hypothetical protein